jgi:hypothetical protein
MNFYILMRYLRISSLSKQFPHREVASSLLLLLLVCVYFRSARSFPLPLILLTCMHIHTHRAQRKRDRESKQITLKHTHSPEKRPVSVHAACFCNLHRLSAKFWGSGKMLPLLFHVHQILVACKTRNINSPASVAIVATGNTINMP